jgi:hypothetical protein
LREKKIMGNNELMAYKIVTEKQKKKRRTEKKRRNDEMKLYFEEENEKTISNHRNHCPACLCWVEWMYTRKHGRYERIR